MTSCPPPRPPDKSIDSKKPLGKYPDWRTIIPETDKEKKESHQTEIDFSSGEKLPDMKSPL